MKFRLKPQICMLMLINCHWSLHKQLIAYPMIIYSTLSKKSICKTSFKISVVSLFAICFSANAQDKAHSVGNQIMAQNVAEEQCKTHLDSSKQAYDEANYVLFKQLNDTVLTIAREHHLIKPQIKGMINLGIYYNVMNAYEMALKEFYAALELNMKSENNDEKVKINILVNLANVYNQIGNTDKVIANMEEIIEVSQREEIPDIIKIAAYNGLGVSYTKKKNYEKALLYLNKLKNYGELTNNDEAILTALDNLGYLQYQRKLWDKVIELGKESMAYSEEKGLLKRPVAMLNLGMAHVKKMEPEMAIPYLKEVLIIAQERNNLKIEKEGHLHLSKAYKLMGDFKNSHKEQELYAELMKSLLQEQSNASILDVQHTANSEKRNIESKVNSLVTVNDRKSKAIIVGGISMVFLGGMLFLYRRKKETAEADSKRFKEANVLLRGENKNLRTALLELALQQEKNHGTEAAYKNSSLTEEDREGYTKLILDHMQKEKPYLNFDFDQSELASRLSMSRHHLSEVLNLCFNQNFYQFVNLYRVNEAQNLMKDPAYGKYKMLAIAYESGFKSKTSFNRVFKKYTGITPTEFKKQYT